MSGAPDRYPLLTALDVPADLRRLPLTQLPTLAGEVRSFLRNNVTTRPDHLAAGLATVELAIALHYVFDTPADRVVWDSGHQAWPHKLLTGRRDRLHTIGEPGGLRPFPQRTESEYDAFGVGHCGTALGAALGMAIAAARHGEHRPGRSMRPRRRRSGLWNVCILGRAARWPATGITPSDLR